MCAGYVTGAHNKLIHYLATGKFKSAFKGMVLALFTLDEYLEYVKNASNLNRRMMSMLIERLKSQVQLFDKHSS